MKQLSWSLLATLMACLLIFSACNKDDDDDGNSNSDTPSFTATVSPNAIYAPDFTYTNFAADFSQMATIEDLTVTGAAAYIDADTLSIYSYEIINSDTNQLVLNIILNADRVGVYDIDYTTDDIFGSDAIVNSGFYNSSTFSDELSLASLLSDSKSGSKIEITEYDDTNKLVSGTFSFAKEGEDDAGAAVEIINVSNGVFNKLPILTQ